MRGRVARLTIAGLMMAASLALIFAPKSSADDENQIESAKTGKINRNLSARLRELGFTGKIESTLEQRLGHSINSKLADLGRLLWFDTLTGLNNDNTCGGCHSPTNGFGDTQSIAIGIENN